MWDCHITTLCCGILDRPCTWPPYLSCSPFCKTLPSPFFATKLIHPQFRVVRYNTLFSIPSFRLSPSQYSSPFLVSHYEHYFLSVFPPEIDHVRNYMCHSQALRVPYQYTHWSCVIVAGWLPEPFIRLFSLFFLTCPLYVFFFLSFICPLIYFPAWVAFGSCSISHSNVIHHFFLHKFPLSYHSSADSDVFHLRDICLIIGLNPVGSGTSCSILGEFPSVWNSTKYELPAPP